MTTSSVIDNLKPSFYRPQRSWGQVIFSEACVKNSVHRGVCMAGGYAWQGACMAGGMHGRGGVHGRGAVCVAGGVHGKGHAWWGVCMVVACVVRGRAYLAEGMHGRGHAWWGTCMVGACMVGGGFMHGIRSMSGRYASYWNAFLFTFCNIFLLVDDLDKFI